MVTSSISESQTSVFPCFKQHIFNEKSESDKILIVCFTSNTSGTVFHQKNTDRRIGEYSKYLIDCDDPKSWKPFNGQITITIN